MKLFAALCLLFLLLSSPVNSNGVSDPVINNSNFQLALYITEEMFLQGVNGLPVDEEALAERDFLIAKAIIEVYQIDPSDSDTHRQLIGLTQHYLRIAEKIIFRRY